MSSLNVYERRRKMDLSDNQWLPTTPTKSTPLSHICDESIVISTSLGGDNEIAAKRSTFADSVPDQESAAINKMAPSSQSCDLDDKFVPSFGVSTPGKPIPLGPNSHVSVESSVFAPPREGDLETVTERADTADPTHDQESKTTVIDKDAGHDITAKLTESTPILGTSTPATKDRKRKANQQNNVATLQKKKKKVYWPKVQGQTKRKTTPKVPHESKTKGRRVSKVNGDNGKYKRTSKSKSAKKSKESASKVDEGRFDMFYCEAQYNIEKHEVQNEWFSTLREHIMSEKTLSRSKRKPSKRSLTFELEENFEDPIHMQNELDELGFKGDSLHILKKKIPQKRMNLNCPLLVRIRRMKFNFPTQKRSESQKRKRIRELKLPFQYIKKRKRSNNRRRKINLCGIVICNQISLPNQGVDEGKTENLGLEGDKFEWKTKGKRAIERKKAKSTNFTIDKIPKQEFGNWETREGSKALCTICNFVKCPLDEDNESENEVRDERKGKARRTRKSVSSKEMKVLIKKFQSLSINYGNKEKKGASYKNQERRLISYKGSREGWPIKVNVNNTELVSYKIKKASNRSFSSWKGSVLDSVIGVSTLIVNSSAYMSLASTFPIKTSEERKGNLPLLKLENSSSEASLNLGNKRLYSPGMVFGKKKPTSTRKKGDQAEQERKKKEEEQAEEQDKQYWESLRRRYIQNCTPRSGDHADSVDWEAVRCADVNKVAKAIEGRGQHNIIAQRIQALLNKLVEMHGSIDLEWLRYAPPYEVKEYLLKVYGLGLKSVECIRLLALKQIAFPVDVNVGRIAVRLGWVPLEPLPGSIQFHLLDQYPIIDMVQQYLWPRLCTLDQPTLYQLHYHLITFGKVFCTKKQPNCKACPMRGECKHFASASASPTFALPGNDAEGRPNNSSERSDVAAKHLEGFSDPLIVSNVKDTSTTNTKECEPIVDYPASPIAENTQAEIVDIEDLCKGDDDPEEFITIKLNEERLNYFERSEMENSNVVVAYNPNRGKSMPKMKSVSRLRTERMVYVLPDTHPLLAEFPVREIDDPSNYLLVMWTPGELKEPCEATTQNQCSCSNNNCFFCNNIKEANNQTVPGTILVPCRTATNGRFPLNGTYFQVNEVFADAASSQHPIDVPTKWLWNLPTRIAYFGTSTSTIFRGLPLEEIQECFWRGYVCVRATDRKTGAPRPLPDRFHCKTADQQIMKKKKKQRNNEDLKGNESVNG
ncbi:DEMETER-like protein 3 [Neltuma alba]|uniref:DEMETER-like protein 3 n=1 Tax=Neltuma alba TaxID=207710 RepID=UPI0010A4F88F|nr:DEMETER-like protein 3 [Prosopis alba]